MAKKKSKRRRPPPRRPAQAAAATPAGGAKAAEEEQPSSRRAERKEEARRERERRIKQARRRQRTRRLTRWGIAVAVVGGIVAVWWFTGRQSRELAEAAASAADRVNASQVEEQEEIPAQHVEPYTVGQGGVPSYGGNHTNGTLPQEPKVYSQSVPEETAVHNLEHGYVFVYYADQGENSLPDDIISKLEDLVESETEVLMAPYPELADPLYLVAWGARQSVDPPADANPDDVVLVTEAFIDEYKNGPFAPEAEVS